jgi:hypothetical protein
MKQVIFVLLIVSYSLFSLEAEAAYPTNQVERPLTLPAGLWELGVGAAYFQFEEDSDYTLRPLLSLRYGITDNLEFYLLGLRYRFLNRPPVLELLAKGRIVSGGSSSVEGTYFLTELGIEGKQRINPIIAFLYRLEEYYTYYSQTEDKSDLRISLVGQLSLTERLALELTGTYRRLWGFDEEHARIFATRVHYNVSSIFDILFEGEFSNFSESRSLRVYSKSFRKAYGIMLNWRF